MSLKLKVWNTGIEGMEYASVFYLKMPSGMHVIVKGVISYHLPFMAAVL